MEGAPRPQSGDRFRHCESETAAGLTPDYGRRAPSIRATGLRLPARWQINAVTVVNNNNGGAPTKGGHALCTFNQTNFARIAEDMGALAFGVENAAAFPAALAAGRPAVIDIDALAPLAVS
jgi:hypothetical protein